MLDLINLVFYNCAMGGETVMDSWFGNFWRTSRKSIALEPEKSVIGILSFEVASLMSKVVNLWHCLSDKQILRLREEIMNSHGLRKLVSDDDDYLIDLVLAEIIHNLRSMVKAVARLGKRCTDPIYHNLENIFDDTVANDLNWYGWEYTLKKMERKCKKMMRFVAATTQLYQELEVLAELEQSLRRMQASDAINRVKLLEFQQKVMWQRQEVKNLRDMSPWKRTYDYTVRLLLRSLFTIVERVKYVFGVNQMEAVEGNTNLGFANNDCLVRSHSVSSLAQSSVYPSDGKMSGFSASPLVRSVSNLGIRVEKNKKLHANQHSSILFGGKHSRTKSRQLSYVGPFKGCIMGGSDSPVLQGCMPSNTGLLGSNGAFQNDIDLMKNTSPMPLSCRDTTHSAVFPFKSKHKLNAPPSTLGGAALALHYANLITLIEKLAYSPHLISSDARDDLYNMLTISVRTSLRAKLKMFTKTLASSVYDAALAAEWNSALTRILEWLAPLAHNTIRWHSERNFEKQRMVSGANILLVQTLYFANQENTEAAITELLMGLNYLSRFDRELNEKVSLDSACGRASDDYLFCMDIISKNVINHVS